MTTHQKSLGDRMKEYENVTNATLYKRMPIILRIDGRAFHTFTRGLKTPYDERFINLMNYTMIEVFESLPDATLGYVESDEISILLCPYSSYETEPVFSARIQKLCSVAASIATQAFIKKLYESYFAPLAPVEDKELGPYLNKDITFDCRCFNLTKEEVANYFIWRQQDCRRNSILNVAHEYLGKKNSIGFKTPELIDKLLNEKEIDYWAITPKYVHLGRTCFRNNEGKTEIRALDFKFESVLEGIRIMINFDYEERFEYVNFLMEKNDERS